MNFEAITITIKDMVMHHCIGCEAPQAAAQYVPSFYSIKLGEGVEIRDIVNKINARVQYGSSVDENTKFNWIYFCHEYVHFLQDIRCSFFMGCSLRRMKKALGSPTSGCIDDYPDPKECIDGLSVKDCSVDMETGAAIVKFCGHGDNDYRFSEVALCEAIAKILEDKLWELYERPHTNKYIPYDVPYCIAEYLLDKNIIPSEELRPRVVDVCEAALMTKSPWPAFISYFKSLGNTGGVENICYKDALKWFRDNHVDMCKEFDTHVFCRQLRMILSAKELSSFATWVTSKVDLINRISSKQRIGLFRAIYEGCLFAGASTMDQYAILVAKVGYPLIMNDKYMDCDEGISDEENKYIPSLITAYDIACNEGKPTACFSLPYCKSADVARNCENASMVSECCQSNPTKVKHGKYSCPFEVVWRLRDSVGDSDPIVKGAESSV